MQKGTWRDIYRSGQSFHDSAGVLWRESTTLLTYARGPVDIPFVLPAVVCTAFAVELFLKALVTVEKGGTPRGHSLTSLFSRLSHESQVAIDLRFCELVAGSPTVQAMKIQFPQMSLALPDVLSDSDRAFETLRYSYEGNVQDGSPRCLNELAAALRERLSQLDAAA